MIFNCIFSITIYIFFIESWSLFEMEISITPYTYDAEKKNLIYIDSGDFAL